LGRSNIHDCRLQIYADSRPYFIPAGISILYEGPLNPYTTPNSPDNHKEMTLNRDEKDKGKSTHPG
jgi:hypothetical protein